MPAKAATARTRVLMDGIKLGELTRWHDGRVWFGDWLAETLYSVGEGGDVRTEATIASLPFSIDWLPDGRMLVVNARAKTLQRREADGRFVTHADLSGLSEYGCNEIVVDGRGNVYVNNINFDFPEGRVPARLRRAPHARRNTPPRRRGARLSQRDGGDTGQPDADRRGVLQREPDGLRHRRRRRPRATSGSGRTSRARAPTASASMPKAASGPRPVRGA